MFGLGIPELALIAVVLFVLFGGKSITELARSFGRFTGEFRKGKTEVENELRKIENEIKYEKVEDGK